jgi:methionyl aminopeptidase
MSRVESKSDDEIQIMRRAGRLVAEVLQMVREKASPGVTTGYLDEIAENYFREHGGRPAFKGYQGYPATLCTSINEQVVHGIPGDRELKDGDLLSVDAGVFIDGYAGDAAMTILVGNCSEEARKLVDVTRRALDAAIEAIRPDVPVGEVSRAVQREVEKSEFGVVRKYTGHGIGSDLHEPPQIPNFVAGRRTPRKPVLPEGATVAIEPMVNAGSGKTKVLSDGWTVVTADGKLSAHFEHTVAVGAHGADVLTVP